MLLKLHVTMYDTVDGTTLDQTRVFSTLNEAHKSALYHFADLAYEDDTVRITLDLWEINTGKMIERRRS